MGVVCVQHAIRVGEFPIGKRGYLTNLPPLPKSHPKNFYSHSRKKKKAQQNGSFIKGDGEKTSSKAEL